MLTYFNHLLASEPDMDEIAAKAESMFVGRLVKLHPDIVLSILFPYAVQHSYKSTFVFCSSELSVLELDDEGGRTFLRVLIHLIMQDYPPLVSGSLQLIFKHFSQRAEMLQAFKQVHNKCTISQSVTFPTYTIMLGILQFPTEFGAQHQSKTVEA